MYLNILVNLKYIFIRFIYYIQLYSISIIFYFIFFFIFNIPLYCNMILFISAIDNIYVYIKNMVYQDMRKIQIIFFSSITHIHKNIRMMLHELKFKR